MRIKSLPVLLALMFIVQSCSASGPVHFYDGSPRPTQELARLIVPGPISVLEIDGKDADVPSIEDGVYHIYLLPGLHRIDFKYELYWGSAVSGYLVESDDYGVETRFAAGKTYRLTYPEPADMDAAEELASDFKATLVEAETGRQVAARPVQELERAGVRSTLLSQQADSRPSASTPTPPADIDANRATREDAVKRLKFWWLMADEDERRRFLRWQRSLQPQGREPDADAQD